MTAARALWGLVVLLQGTALAAGYDPLAISGRRPAPWDGTAADPRRGRELPVRVFLPEPAAPAPVVLFSHGLGGSREGSNYLGIHWAQRGYVAVYVQHPGSDAAVWRELPQGARREALRRAASVENFTLRVADVPAVLDQLARWHAQAGHPLAGRLDLERVGMAGHSFGAVTAQAVSGQAMPLPGVSFTDARLKAAVLMSPSLPRRGDAARAFGSVAVPWLLMTGTRDEAPLGGQTAASRQQVFPALPPGGRYEVVLEGAEHSAFTDRGFPGDVEVRNPNHHRVILALSTAFWDAHLRGDPIARAWLEGPGVRAVLSPADRWRFK